MAVLGFHIVVSLIVVCIISKCASRVSMIKAYIVKGLYRFIAPSNNELRSLMPAKKDANPKKRRQRREEEDSTGFNIPKQLPLQLKIAPVDEMELQNFVFYTSVHWMSLFTPLACLVYTLSEIWLMVSPGSQDTNVSILWLIIAIAFVLQMLTKLTAYLLMNEDERGLLLSFAALYFLASCIVSMWSDRMLDVELMKAYDHFSENVANLMLETGATAELDTKPKSPLLLYISLSVFFSFLSSMLVFPNFRYATLYTRSLMVASPVKKVLLHISFLLPALCVLLFLRPVKYYLIDGPRKLITEPQLDILRVYIAIAGVITRLLLRREHLQSHLDLSYDKVQQLQKETGHVRNVQLQSMIFRYYSYFCAAVVQYFAPVLLTFFFALLLKTTGGLSWVGAESASRVESAAAASSSAQGTFRLLFDATVCRAVWSFALVVTTAINFSLSLIGVIYNTYFITTV